MREKTKSTHKAVYFYITFLQLSLAALAITLLPNTNAFAEWPVASPQLDTSRSVTMECGGTRVELSCGYNSSFSQMDDRVCNNNTLTFFLPNGQKAHPAPPETFEIGTTPIAISCTKFKDGKFYIPVTYLSGSYNCAQCQQLELFTLEGLPAGTKEKSRSKLLSENSTALWNTIGIESRKRVY